ncbi:hypothetical protein BKA56DRAFT_636019 [Ilyonectria sp. MPI-CAGE-AT-0026]|nr:hypothetical protein BKA56DRAFT_636019 [Ilyonectria sp. MPI-CAGE-AT-0026]
MTSMIASIAVERHGVPRSAVAEVSIARFTNAGPRSFSKLLLSGATFKCWIRILTAISLLFFVASEFTSTLLVTDLRESRVSSFDQNMSYGFTFQMLGTGPPPLPLIGYAFNYWFNKPSSSEIFAEYSQPGKSGEDLDDTGPSIRAFLPIALQSERESLRSFTGMARVVDTRVKYVAGFDCPILDSPQDFPGQQAWAMCGVSGGATLVSPLTNATSYENSTAGSFSTWMIIDTISLHKGYELWNTTSTWEHLNSSGSGPWLRQWSRVRSDDGEAEQDFYFPITLCFDYAGAAQIRNLNITATATSNSTEPVFRYDADSKQYDTSAVRNQLGASRHNPQKNNTKREILTISEQAMQASMDEVRGKPLALRYVDNVLGDWFGNFLALPTGIAIALCPLCSPDLTPFQIVDSLLTQVFNDVLNTTDSPALALQALRTLLYRSVYYDHLSAFSPAADEATITRFNLVRVPQERSSFVKNAWHTVAQISQSDEARPLPEKATLAADEDIDDWVHKRRSPKGFWGNVWSKVRGIGRLLSQKTTPDSERLSVQNGVFTTVGSR